MTPPSAGTHLGKKWAAIGAAMALVVLAVAAVAAASRGASLLPEITGESSTSGGDLVLLAGGAAACIAIPFVLAALSGRAAWGAAGLTAAGAGVGTVFVVSALDPDATASAVLGLALGVAAAVALQHRSRAEVTARIGLLVAYGALVLLGPRLPAAAAILVLPAVGLVDTVAIGTARRQ